MADKNSRGFPDGLAPTTEVQAEGSKSSESSSTKAKCNCCMPDSNCYMPARLLRLKVLPGPGDDDSMLARTSDIFLVSRRQFFARYPGKRLGQRCEECEKPLRAWPAEGGFRKIKNKDQA